MPVHEKLASSLGSRRSKVSTFPLGKNVIIFPAVGPASMRIGLCCGLLIVVNTVDIQFALSVSHPSETWRPSRSSDFRNYPFEIDLMCRFIVGSSKASQCVVKHAGSLSCTARLKFCRHAQPVLGHVSRLTYLFSIEAAFKNCKH